ncbi:MAG TPA: phosphoglycerate kinase [Candidatus Micrarchaeaceae archaeon]|nr:phosphoglycerate kinase [Candidatus Micrarchaeaceae archaeon]
MPASASRRKAGLDDIDPGGKRVLLRVDFNVPLTADGSLRDDGRLVAALPTIHELLGRGASVIIATHLGRPAGRLDAKLSTRPLAVHLEELLGVPVAWVADCVGPAVERKAAALRPGQVLLLENLRFHPGETENDPEFARQLAALADIYVDDAFGSAHRSHASTEGVTHFLPAVAGRLMATEIAHLSAILSDPRRPLLAIVGGSKLSSKLKLVTHLIDRVDAICVGGAMAATFLKAAAREVGSSLVEDDFLDRALEVVRQAAARRVDLQLPVDVVVARSPEAGAEEIRVRPVGEIAHEEMILDMGPATIRHWESLVRRAGTVVWNGPLGLYEKPLFAVGTQQMARAVAASAAVSVTGGGDLQAAICQLNLQDGFTHVSTGGGATMEFLEGRELPGVVALDDAPRIAKPAIR